MARSSHDLHQAKAWAVSNKPKVRPRVLRLARPANDNVRQTGVAARLAVVTGGVALLAFALATLGIL